MKKFFKNIVVVILVSAVFHTLWEYLAFEMFYSTSLGSSYFNSMLIAVATDIGITVVLYILLSLLNRRVNWIIKRWDCKDFAIMILYGLFLSFYLEVQALNIGRLTYSKLMPLFPGTNIGLIPVIQFVVLFPLTFIISKLILKVVYRNDRNIF
ncbi:hypothetical protein CLPU_6c01170 [Gottschalkia purinilytica]|uniref:Uncharacterized protein n=1 Tax=Gottschalkia purinilytica TaxID=1503 RepID=A0A0L0WAV9_GOTPU|nr:hypothetical protein [Gottschalkia purinilytica]KNF08631.1 hypothetical protein CLPU_6c01170 [Gottschalkia purinilytica]